MSDIPVPPRSVGEIERLAESWRKALDPDDAWVPDVARMIEVAGREFKDVEGLRIVFLPDEEMMGAEARAEATPLASAYVNRFRPRWKEMAQECVARLLTSLGIA